MRTIYLLKDLSRTTSYSVCTLKYYLRIGLLKEIGRSPATNFRYFDDTSVENLKRIRMLRLQGVSLREIGQQLGHEL